MGLETIKNVENKLFWKRFIDDAHIQLKNSEIKSISFDEFKNDGSYAKAKSGLPAVKWVFAEDKSRRWVELELKPRTVKKVKTPQHGLYETIKNNVQTGDLNITWDEEDRYNGLRKPDGMDIRIKCYLDSLNDDLWIKMMIDFIKIFNKVIPA